MPEDDDAGLEDSGLDDGDGFINKLMRRGIVQAGIAYLIFVWLLIQVADATTPILGLPAWLPPLVTFSAIGGIPVVLILAWLLEQSDGRWLRDRGRQSGKIISGLERNYLAIIVGYGIALAGASGYQLMIGFPVPESPETTLADEDVLLPIKPNSVAVLRFLNINDDETAQVFSEGLGEDVLDRLARVPGLAVASRGDSWSLPVNASSDEVRKRLRVAYYIEGSVRLIEDNLRVVVQLIESDSGFHVFSRSFDRKLEDLMAVQREITNLTVANMRVAIPSDTSGNIFASDADPDIDAYVLYRRGKHILDEPPAGESFAQAIELFEQALEIDPGYSAAYAGICRAHVTSYELKQEPAKIDLAKAACNTALAANPNLDVVYSALGKLHLSTSNATEAANAYERALEINPKDTLAMQGMAAVYNMTQQFDEAERILKLAIDLQPGNWRSINSLGGLYFYNGRYAEAARAYRQVVFLDPSNWLGHGNLGSALMMIGEFEAAIDPLNDALRIEQDPYYLSNLGIIYYYLGEYDRSVEVHRQAAGELPGQNSVWVNLGDALRFSSQPDQAEDAYRKAVELGAELLATDPNDPINLYVQAWATAASGDADDASMLIDRALDIAPDDPYVRYYDGLLKNDRGEVDAAIDALGVAVDMGYPVVMLAADPLLEGLHGDNRFEDLVGEISKKIH